MFTRQDKFVDMYIFISTVVPCMCKPCVGGPASYYALVVV